MPAKWQKFTVNLDKRYTPAERRAIAAEIIEHVVSRSESGKDKNNRRLAPYSKGYVNSLDFKNAGKSRGNVNLTLSGDMLASLKLISQRSGKLIIGFQNGTDENARADGNVRGTYGNSTPVARKRDFMGISGNDLRKEILTKYPLNSTKKRIERLELIEGLIKESDEITGGLLSELGEVIDTEG